MATYQTPAALRHDASVLAAEASALVAATAEATDTRIQLARQRLQTALHSAAEVGEKLKSGAREGLHEADESFRQHPYETLLLAFGLGAIAGFFVGNRR